MPHFVGTFPTVSKQWRALMVVLIFRDFDRLSLNHEIPRANSARIRDNLAVADRDENGGGFSKNLAKS